MAGGSFLDAIHLPHDGRDPGHANDYWAWNDYYRFPVEILKISLKSRHYYVHSKTNNAKLIRYLQRGDRSLFSYASCRDEKLREFIVDRGLNLPQNFGLDRTVLRTDLIETLERTDDPDSLRFSLFTSLPPELRNQVYRHYFAVFADKPLDLPVQPPLTMVSRLIREETLPLFYSSCIFKFTLLRSGMSSRLSLPMAMVARTHSTNATDIARIQKLQFCIVRKGKKEWPLFQVDVDLAKEEHSARFPSNRLRFGGLQTEVEALRNACAKTMERIVAKSDNGRRLRKDDIFKLRRGLEKALLKS